MSHIRTAIRSTMSNASHGMRAEDNFFMLPIGNESRRVSTIDGLIVVQFVGIRIAFTPEDAETVLTILHECGELPILARWAILDNSGRGEWRWQLPRGDWGKFPTRSEKGVSVPVIGYRSSNDHDHYMGEIIAYACPTMAFAAGRTWRSVGEYIDSNVFDQNSPCRFVRVDEI